MKKFSWKNVLVPMVEAFLLFMFLFLGLGGWYLGKEAILGALLVGGGFALFIGFIFCFGFVLD